MGLNLLSHLKIQPYSWHDSAPCPDLLQSFLCGHTAVAIHRFSSVVQLGPTLCDPTDCSTLGLPVHHRLPELTQTHVH